MSLLAAPSVLSAALSVLHVVVLQWFHSPESHGGVCCIVLCWHGVLVAHAQLAHIQSLDLARAHCMEVGRAHMEHLVDSI